MIHKCERHGRRICMWCIITTLSFPVEHFIWEKTPLLRSMGAWLM